MLSSPVTFLCIHRAQKEMRMAWPGAAAPSKNFDSFAFQKTGL
jgi:hypothetical protein